MVLRPVRREGRQEIALDARPLRAVLRTSADARRQRFEVGPSRDLKAVNPNRKVEVDSRAPAQILTAIEQRRQEVSEALKTLRALIGS